MNLKAISLTTLALLPAGVLAACGSSDTTASVNSASSGTTAAATTPSGAPNGQLPAGMGTIVTGSAATKAAKAATAKYPGTAEKVMKLSDGSYVVHVITSSGEQHVKVSSSFTVTGLDTSMPARPTDGQAPSGAPQGTTPTTSSSSAQ